MRSYAWPFLFLLAACGPKKDSGKETVTPGDSLATADTVSTNHQSVDVTTVTSTALAKEINGLLHEKFGGTMVLLNDSLANWPKDEFDYFIAPKRKDQPDYPYIVKGDFNGDGQEDAAALVKETVKGKYQVAVIFGAPLDRNRILFWTEDINVCALSTYPKGPLEGMDTGKVNMKGDGIGVEYYEKSSFVLYWNGSAFKRAWTGD